MADWQNGQKERGREFKARMVLAGISQVEVAQAMGVRANTMSQWLNGWLRWPRDFEERITRAIEEVEQANGVAS